MLRCLRTEVETFRSACPSRTVIPICLGLSDSRAAVFVTDSDYYDDIALPT